MKEKKVSLEKERRKRRRKQEENTSQQGGNDVGEARSRKVMRPIKKTASMRLVPGKG